MMKRRGVPGFTLIELAMCITILVLITAPFLLMVEKLHKSYHYGIRLNDLKAELDRVGFRLQGTLRANPKFRLDSDNRGVVFGENSKVEWTGSELWFEGPSNRYKLGAGVTHFSLHRRSGLTYLVLEMEEFQSKNRRRKTFVVEQDGYAQRL